MAQRWRLNPCDYMFLSYDQMMTARGRIGHSTLMVLDLEGEIEPERLRTAIGRAIERHPITNARVRYSRLSGRPFWEACHTVDDGVLRVVDLRGAEDWEAATADELARFLAAPMAVERVAPIRIEYYPGRNRRGKLALRWSHALTDGEGAQWFLSEVAQCDGGTGQPSAGLASADELIDPLASWSFLKRMRLFLSGFRAHSEYGAVPRTTLGNEDAADSAELRIHFRRFDEAEFETIRTNAKRTCPAGPGLYARFLAGCVICAVHQLCEERGLHTPAYLVTLPISVRPSGARPLAGNYLVFATLCGRREQATDPRVLARDLHEQMLRFQLEDRGAAMWALLQVTAWMRARQYRRLLRNPFGLPPYVSGFSYYGDSGPAIEQFVGARVTNLYGVAPLAAPPGWNPIFSRCGSHLNFALTWLRGYIADETALDFAHRIQTNALCAG